jgi:hypothetical protein
VSEVFISYSRDNQEVVRRLAEAVKGLGYDVWWDDQLPPHLAYGDVIAQKVGGAKAAIVVWSANAAASEWVRAEADMARNQRKLIQTTIDGSEPPMPFNQLHYVSLADWNGEPDHPGWTKVKESLTALAGTPAAEAPTVPPTAPIAAPPPAPEAAPPAPVPEPAPPAPEPAPAATAPPVTAAPAAAAAAPAPVAPAPRRKGGNKVLIILIVMSVLVLAGVGVLALLKGRSGAPAGNETNMAGPAENSTAPVNENFNREAMLQGDDEFANVRSGPSAESPIVARVNAGEAFNTYEQNGIWWRVRIAGGLTGYLERAHIRLRDPMSVPPVAPAPGNETAPAPAPGNQVAPAPAPGNQLAPVPLPANPQQQRPRPRPQETRPRPDPRINRENSGVMVDFCKGAGAGTPQCRQLGLSGRRNRR